MEQKVIDCKVTVGKKDVLPIIFHNFVGDCAVFFLLGNVNVYKLKIMSKEIIYSFSNIAPNLQLSRSAPNIYQVDPQPVSLSISISFTHPHLTNHNL